MDPNWFYSSLAQSAAAIVAIISAILFSKIQDLRKNGSENHNKLNNKIDDWTKLKNEIKKTFLEYQSYEPFQRPPMPWDNIKNFNIDVEILNIIHNNEKYIEIENMMQEFLQEYDRLYLSKKDNMGEESLHHVINFKDDEEIINKIIGWWIYTNNLIKDIKNHNKMVSPNIYQNTVLLITLLFISCTILPLYFLDSDPTIKISVITDKMLYLFLFFICYTYLAFTLFKETTDISKELTI